MKPLPKTFKDFVKKYPTVWRAHEALTQACAEAGPLDRKTRELIKVGLSVAANLQTATERHTVMAVENGATAEEVYHAVLMTMTTCGHPLTAAGFKWASDALAGSKAKKGRAKRKK